MANNEYPQLTKAATRLGVMGFAFVLILGMASCGMTTTMGAGEAGVRYSIFAGTDMEITYGEGLKVHAPWVDVTRYNVRVQQRDEGITALSSDGLQIGMEVSIRWRPQTGDGRLPQLHTTYGPTYYETLVQPELRSAAREIVGQYTPEELYSSRRTQLQTEMVERVRRVADDQFVVIEAILIRNVELPEQIQIAIENKLKEEQEAERYQFTIAKERLEAERKEIEARGQAEYQRIITESLSQQFLQFKGIETTQELANSPNSKTVIIGSGEGGLPLILGGQ